MELNSSTIREFLVELYNRTQGDEESQVSMHEIGETLGLDKSQAGALGEEIIVEGLAELRTLAGGVSITSQGVDLLRKAGLITVAAKSGLQLSGGPVLLETDREEINRILSEIRQGVAEKKASFEMLEEIIIDVKTVEVQLLSPQPKTAVVRELFRSLETPLNTLGLETIAQALSEASQ